MSAPDAEGVSTAAHARHEDARLVTCIVRGDMSAFDTLYRRMHPRLRRFLERVTRRPQLVDEIVNDTMLVVWRKAATYDGTSSVSTWVFAIGYRKALKALKALDEPLDVDLDEQPHPDLREPDSVVLLQETRALLDDALSALSAEQRAVVELTYFHECAYREIAAILGCPVDTVKTRMFHARRKLRTALADQRGAMP